MASEDWKRELTDIFFARSGVIWITTLAIFACALAIAVLWPPTYSATASLRVIARTSSLNPGGLTPERDPNLPPMREDLTSEVEMITSPDVLRRTLLATGDLERDPAIYDKVREIRRDLVAEVIPNANVIKVTLLRKDMEKAEELLAVHLREYLQYRAAILTPTEEQQYLNERVDDYQKRLDAVQDELIAKSKANKVMIGDRELSSNIDLKQGLVSKLNDLRDELVGKQKEVIPLQEAMAADPNKPQYFTFLQYESLTVLSSKLMELTAEKAKERRSFQSDSERVKAIDQNIQILYHALRDEVARILAIRTNEIEVLKARITQIESQIAQMEQKNMELQQAVIEFNRLQQEQEHLKSSLDIMRRKRDEAYNSRLLTESSLSGQVRVISGPEGTGQLVFPLPFITMALGLIVGFITGCSLAFTIEFMDHTIKRPSDVARHAQLPVILSIRKA